jgi:Ran-binding protein 9/10
VLDNNPQILFRLKCRKWVELISKAADLKAQSDPKSKQKSTASNGFNKDSAIDDDFTQDMELDEQPNGKTAASDASGQSQQYDQLLAEAMGYGQVLQREYRDEQSEEWNKTLLDIFSLVAYENPRDSVHGGLLERKGRVVVAEELNSAILVTLGRSPAAALEKVYKQTEALIDVLARDGGPAAFVNLEKDLR